MLEESEFLLERIVTNAAPSIVIHTECERGTGDPVIGKAIRGEPGTPARRRVSNARLAR